MENDFIDFAKNAAIPRTKKQIREAFITALDVSIISITSIADLKKLKQGKSLMEIGICDGLTTIIDTAIQEVIPEMCVITEDTYDKILIDLDRELNKH